MIVWLAGGLLSFPVTGVRLAGRGRPLGLTLGGGIQSLSLLSPAGCSLGGQVKCILARDSIREKAMCQPLSGHLCLLRQDHTALGPGSAAEAGGQKTRLGLWGHRAGL